ncbi:hypothetical protein BDP27DRAFT_422024 [Rhodocollybia butyracea]|uniref:Uncharacterized protein n=1 Tax=Rhodocollybia butyracea TaxID=206335 RepID=A0A9P5PBM4_9AGAR|nr:hypothetical protein BDP27DRAFT_422024 [Rhodocollybia butyracea]
MRRISLPVFFSFSTGMDSVHSCRSNSMKRVIRKMLSDFLYPFLQRRDIERLLRHSTPVSAAVLLVFGFKDPDTNSRHTVLAGPLTSATEAAGLQRSQRRMLPKSKSQMMSSPHRASCIQVWATSRVNRAVLNSSTEKVASIALKHAASDTVNGRLVSVSTSVCP